MAAPFLKSSFAGGEISPSLWGNIDFAKYHIGASTMRNMFVSFKGGAYSRAGTAFVGYSKQIGRPYPPRLVTFQFSINQGLALEFGNEYMRVISNGAYVTEGPGNITAITNASPAKVTQTGHGYSTGDWVAIAGVGGMTQVNGQTYVITVLDSAHYTLADVFGNPIDSTSFGVYTTGGQGSRIYTLVTPYADVDLPFLKWTQSADVMSLCLRNQDTGTEYPSYDLSRIADNNWALTAFSAGAVISGPSTISVSASVYGNSSSTSTYATAYAYVVTAVDHLTGEESNRSPVGNCTNSVDISLTAGSLTINWARVGGANRYNVYKAQPSFNSAGNPFSAKIVPVGAEFGYIATCFGTQFVDSNVVADFSQVPPVHADPFQPGQILDINITSPGSGLTTVTYTITTSTGTGFFGVPVVNGNQLTGFVIFDSGQNYLPGDTIAFNHAGYAAGAITFGVTNPSASDTITLNGVVWTFVSALTGANQTLIQGSVTATITQLVADLNASGNPSISVATYSADTTNGALDITYNTAGTAGNSYTLAASAATPSGSTLTGGSGTAGTAPTATLVLGPESGTYPSVVSYIQQRRVYANTANNPDTYYMSQPGLFKNFDSRIPTVDTDAIIGTPWSVQVNGIQWMIPMPGGLVVLTGLQAWQLTGNGGSSLNPQPITPSSQQAQPQAYNGAHDHVPPIRIGYDINYVQAKGSVIRDLNYNFFLNIYTGTDITFLSSQMFLDHQIQEMAWCEEPYKLMWVARDDGVLLCLTYLKEQEIVAWSRHDTQGGVVSITSVTEPPVDALYLAVQRTVATNTSYMVERMDNRLWSNVEECWCVDSGLSLPQPTPAAFMAPALPYGAGIPTGITGLVGGSGYSSATVATVIDTAGTGPGFGFGCVATPTIVGGVITGVVLAGGTLYRRPKISFTDSGGGTGASATVVLNNSTTISATAAVFSSGDVGSVIRGAYGAGRATITAYINSTTVTANVTIPFAVVPNTGGLAQVLASGQWTKTVPTATVTGLQHLAGATVTGLADGQVIPPTLVPASGTITLATPASSIIIGLGFTAQLQALPLNVGSEPTVQGQRKKIGAVTALVENSGAFQMGANQIDGSVVSPPQIEVIWQNMQAAPNLAPPYYGTGLSPLQTGYVRVPVTGGPGQESKRGQAAFQQTMPLPLQVNSIMPEVLPGDMPDIAEKQEQGGGGRGQEQRR